MPTKTRSRVNGWAVNASPLVVQQADIAKMTRRYALPESDLPVEQWLKKNFPHLALKPFASRHISLWGWFDALRPGVKPRPRLEIWPRGGAKSSTGELGAVRVGAKATRQFALYVCETQDQADEHVAAIANLLETMKVRRALSVYGTSRGWKRSQLRAENGFNVAAFGLDGAKRGVKMDEYRPDLIILDDIDGRHDSPEVVIKKEQIITDTLLPAGSVDVAVLGLQNLIHQGSIFSRALEGLSDFLLNREIPTCEPAVIGLETEEVPREDGDGIMYRITAGTPTWAGQDLEICEGQINEWGLSAFLRESQHQVKLEGAFFAGFDPDVHTIVPPYQPGELPMWWNYYGGLDEGYNDPFAFTFCATDEQGKNHVIESVTLAGLTPEEQADQVAAVLERWEMPFNRVLIAFDRTMKTDTRFGLKVEANIEAFYRKGLYAAPASQNPLGRWARIREDLRMHMLVFWRGYNADLTRAVSSARFHATKPEHMAHDWCSHLCDALGYSYDTRPTASVEPQEDPLAQVSPHVRRMLEQQKSRARVRH